MAEVFAPFVIEKTIGNLTFYQMDGKNYVRKKSSLTRKKVLHSPRFERTRQYAGLMAKASRIGSQVYKTLPVYWRQFWMYRSFTGEALTLLKAGKKEQEIQQLLWERYVKEVLAKQEGAQTTLPINTTHKRKYRKSNTAYWKGKTIKSERRKARKALTGHYANMLARASKIAKTLYRQLPLHERRRRHYWQYVSFAMQLLKEEWGEAEIIGVMRTPVPLATAPKQQTLLKEPLGKLCHREGYFYFLAPLRKSLPAIDSSIHLLQRGHLNIST